MRQPAPGQVRGYAAATLPQSGLNTAPGTTSASLIQPVCGRGGHNAVAVVTTDNPSPHEYVMSELSDGDQRQTTRKVNGKDSLWLCSDFSEIFSHNLLTFRFNGHTWKMILISILMPNHILLDAFCVIETRVRLEIWIGYRMDNENCLSTYVSIRLFYLFTDLAG